MITFAEQCGIYLNLLRFLEALPQSSSICLSSSNFVDAATISYIISLFCLCGGFNKDALHLNFECLPMAISLANWTQTVSIIQFSVNPNYLCACINLTNKFIVHRIFLSIRFQTTICLVLRFHSRVNCPTVHNKI